MGSALVAIMGCLRRELACDLQSCQTLLLLLRFICAVPSWITVILLFARCPQDDQQNYGLYVGKAVPGILMLLSGGWGGQEESDFWLIESRFPRPGAPHSLEGAISARDLAFATL